MSIFHTKFHARIGQYWEVWKIKIISVFTWHTKQRLKTHTAFSKSFQNFCCCYVSIVPAGPRGTKYECPYCPLPLLLPQFLRLILCPSCACNTSPPLCTPDCTSVTPNCPSLSTTFLSQAGSCIMRRLGKTWTWTQRRAVSGGNQYLSRATRTKEQEGNPKSMGTAALQWAIYKGVPILTSRPN